MLTTAVRSSRHKRRLQRSSELGTLIATATSSPTPGPRCGGVGRPCTPCSAPALRRGAGSCGGGGAGRAGLGRITSFPAHGVWGQVTLSETDEGPQSTYINANYVRGNRGRSKAYIAAMGPLPTTVGQWWRMVWQERVHDVVMITRLKEKGAAKCALYWPIEPGGRCEHAGIRIEHVAVVERGDYQRTVLRIEWGGQQREVVHWWYNSWPDHGVPVAAGKQVYADGVLALIGEVNASAQPTDGPILVHCSAGVGRTGTYIAIDIALAKFQLDGTVRLLDIIVRTCASLPGAARQPPTQPRRR